MVQAREKFYLRVEVVGCSTICLHCLAQGIGYQAMPADYVAFVPKDFTRARSATCAGPVPGAHAAPDSQ